MERLKKEQLIQALVDAGKVETKKGASELIDSVDAVIEVASELVEVGQKIAIGKYITLEETHKEASIARNPSNGESIDVPAKDVLKIKKSAQLDKLV